MPFDDIRLTEAEEHGDEMNSEREHVEHEMEMTPFIV
jgi:hypothetical protein